jgi:hypothetical protein
MIRRTLMLEEEARKLRHEVVRDRDNLDGAVVRLTFMMDGKRQRPGDRISREAIRAMPRSNFDAMCGRYFIPVGV